MKFSILVPAYNEEQLIESCLNTLLSIGYKNKEIVVIDDASTDNTVHEVEKISLSACDHSQAGGKDIILVKREKNGGRAAALNSGLQKATGDIIVTTDADTLIPPDWLEKFRDFFRQSDVVAVGGTYRARNKNNPLAHANSIMDQILTGLLKKKFVPNKLSGVNSAILRQKLLDLGGFNEDAWWSEDSELGWRLKSIGNVVYDPNNIVYTYYPDTWKGIWRRKYYWGYAMGLKFRKHLPFNIKLWIRPIVFTALFLSLLVTIVTIILGIRFFWFPAITFFFLLSLLTIIYLPFGAYVISKDKDKKKANAVTIRLTFTSFALLMVLPIVREFAYVCGMCLGFCKGRSENINPSWKEK